MNFSFKDAMAQYAMAQLYESASAASKSNAPTRLKSSPQVSGSASASAAGNGESSSVGRRKTSDVSLAQRQIGRDLETTSMALDSHSQPP